MIAYSARFVVFFGLIALLVVGGCGPAGSKPSGGGNSAKSQGTAGSGSPVDADILAKIGEYMPPAALERGALQLAAPKGWKWERAGDKYLVGFFPESSSSTNDLPRILISAEDSPYSDISKVTADNAGEFLKKVSASLKDAHLRVKPEVRTIGEGTWVEYATLGKSGGSLVARQVLQTVSDGRMYTIQLEVYDNQLDRARKFGLAVAASAKFTSDEPAAEIAPPEAEPPAEEASAEEAPAEEAAAAEEPAVESE